MRVIYNENVKNIFYDFNSIYKIFYISKERKLIMKKLINGLALSMLLLTGCKSGISYSSSSSSYYNSTLSSESSIISTIKI